MGRADIRGSERIVAGLFAFALAVLVPAGQPATAAAPGPDPGQLDRVLKAHLGERGVRYRALLADTKARAVLDAFTEAAASMPESVPLSTWLNVYNALVIQGVLQHYPLKSVMDVKGFFKTKHHRVAGRLRSLDDIENGVIRPRFKDARIHMALNCGAVSCPPLMRRAFREETLQADLDRLSRAAVADGHHVRVVDGQLHVSAIFFWFAQDFTRDAGSVQAWLQRYDKSGKLAKLGPAAKLVQRSYDWTLNEGK